MGFQGGGMSVTRMFGAVLAMACVLAFGGGTAAAAGLPQANWPADAGTIDAGNAHTCAIRADGSPVCWGRNDQGQATIPAGTGTVKQISAGYAHTCAIRSDDTPRCWGHQASIPAGIGTVTDIQAGYLYTCAIKTGGIPVCWGLNNSGQTSIPAGIGTVSQITTGEYHTCAIKTDGTPVCWGLNDGGQSAIPAGIGTVKQITAGIVHTCAIKTDGTPVCWGATTDANFGQAVVPAEIGTVAAIRAGDMHTCAIRTDGTPVCWGWNGHGQTTIPIGVGTVTQIALGKYHTCAIRTDGSTVCWGQSGEGQTAAPAGPFVHRQIEVGAFSSCAVRTDSTPVCWGNNSVGQGSVPDGIGTVTQISANVGHVCVVKTDGTPACWGNAGGGRTSIPAGTGRVTQIASGTQHTCAIEPDGTPACWGAAATALPPGIGTVVEITSGANFSCAIKSDGVPVCWGSNARGQLTIPAGLGSVTQITAGTEHTCAVKVDGTPVCWGRDIEGQSTVPAGLGTVTQIAAGSLHTCAIRTGGTPICWGSNGSGQTTIPAVIGTVTQLSLGESHTCAIKTDGYGVCWGSNALGQTASATGWAAQPPYSGSSAFVFDTVQTAARPAARYALSSGTLPAGLTFDPVTGRITGTATQEGVFSITVSDDNDVVSPTSHDFTLRFDFTAPSTTDDVPAGYQPGPVTVTLTATDGAGSGVDKTYYTKGVAPAAPTTSSLVYDPANKPTLGDGEKIRYFSVDMVGNVGPEQTSGAAKVDTAPPTTADDVGDQVYPSAVTVTLTADDGAGSGVAKTYFTKGVTPAEPTTASEVYDPANKPTLGNGESIRYFSVDQVGNAEASKTSRAVRIGGGGGGTPVEPDTFIDKAPAALGRDPRPSITFSSPATASFECSFDGAPFTACKSPITPAAPLADGEHRFEVRAVNSGTPDATPALIRFVIDTTAPAAPQITSGPEGETTERTPTFTFTGEPRAVFSCSIDGRPVATCSSPVTLSEFAPGAHSFHVLQFDAAGNPSPVASREFTVVEAPAPLCFGRPATIVATGQDRIRGTKGDDVILGAGGAETINGRGGNDRICSVGGADRVKGGTGNDRIDGGKAADRLDGGAGNDTLVGGRAKDLLKGGPGRDWLRSIRMGTDVDDCGPGSDKVRADGNDVLRHCEKRA